VLCSKSGGYCSWLPTGKLLQIHHFLNKSIVESFICFIETDRLWSSEWVVCGPPRSQAKAYWPCCNNSLQLFYWHTNRWKCPVTNYQGI
jgi:hypothetical protein